MPALRGKIRGFQAWVRQYERAVERATTRVLGGVANQIARSARAEHKFENRTRELQGSIKPLPVVQMGSTFVSGVIAHAEYASYVENNVTARGSWAYLQPAFDRNQRLFYTMGEAVGALI